MTMQCLNLVCLHALGVAYKRSRIFTHFISGRLIVKHAEKGVPGRNGLALSYGFFTKSVAEQCCLLSSILGSADYCDSVPQTVPLPLNEQRISAAQNKKLRIGYFVNDGFIKPVPAYVFQV